MVCLLLNANYCWKKSNICRYSLCVYGVTNFYFILPSLICAACVYLENDCSKISISKTAPKKLMAFCGMNFAFWITTPRIVITFEILSYLSQESSTGIVIHISQVWHMMIEFQRIQLNLIPLMQQVTLRLYKALKDYRVASSLKIWNHHFWMWD